MKTTAQQRLESITALRKFIRDNSEKITEGQFSASREYGRLFGNANAAANIKKIQTAAQKEWGAGWEKRATQIDQKEKEQFEAAKIAADKFWAELGW